LESINHEDDHVPVTEIRCSSVAGCAEPEHEYNGFRAGFRFQVTMNTASVDMDTLALRWRMLYRRIHRAGEGEGERRGRE